MGLILSSGGIISTLQPPVPSYQLVFNDDFTSFNGDANGDVGWMTLYPFGTRTNNTGPPALEAQCYVDPSVAPGISPFTILPGDAGSNGILAITASLASVTGANPLGLPYNSGLICSVNSFYMQYGYFEARIQVPPGAGMWSAFWMLCPTLVWPPEIDAMEQFGLPNNRYHLGNFYGSSGSPQQNGQFASTKDVTQGFHIYGVDIEPTTVTYYFDRQQTAQYALQTGSPGSQAQPLYVLVNLAIGTASNSFVGQPNANTPMPATMYVDWVRAWASPNSTGIGGTQVL